MATCALCHRDTVNPDNSINVAGGLHINGVIDLPEGGCNACHGNNDNAAPPRSVAGAEDTAVVEVGAHQAHVRAGPLREALDCDACHRVPERVGDEGHMDASPADLTWGALATTNNSNPAWDRDAETCAETYCHGATLSGGSNTAPRWTLLDGSQAACGTCHGAPPPAPHPDNPDCSLCHRGTVNPDNSINVDGGLHINGRIDLPGLNCNACHGSVDNAAPPVSLRGAEDTAVVEVGAHQTHVLGGDLHPAFDCDACHRVPDELLAEGHMDASPAELTWGALATTGDLVPAWDRETATCSEVYCHGATLDGGSITEPVWTAVDGSQRACGTCHGAPPPPPHPDVVRCNGCHRQTVREDGSIDLAGGKHINGAVDLPDGGCSSCHGSEVSPAPPVDLAGSDDTTEVTVGAHRSHVTTGDLRLALGCSACHVVPESIGAEGHMDAPPAEITWGVLATTGGLEPGWDRDTGTCANVYCHGVTLTGGSLNEPDWTRVDGSQSACGTCHGAPPPAPHPNVPDCALCHRGTVNADGSINVDGGLHINGVIDVPDGACNGCHGNDDNPAPPRSLLGDEDTGVVEVGAHQAHVRDGDLRAGMACGECHVEPAEVGAPGHMDASPAELTWGALSSTGAADPRWSRANATCSSVYCHGATLSGGSLTEPLWTRVDGTQAACGTCHGTPPPAPHPDVDNCALCHRGTVNGDGTINVAGGLHINGVIDVPDAACNGWHGNDDNPAPPVSLRGSEDTGDVEVGAHQAHVRDGELREALDCDVCHRVPDRVGAPGHMDASPAEVTWGALATAEGATPAWDRAAASCSETYCHGATLGGGSLTEPRWTRLDGTQAACGTCHGAPPPAPHPDLADCNLCHRETVNVDGSINVAGGKHINGTVDVPGGACNGCHGSDENAAPPVSLRGSNDTGDIEVGGHQEHVRDGPIRGAMGCEACHRVPGAVDAPGHMDAAPAEVTWGALAATDGAQPVWDRETGRCSGVYCHGATLAGGQQRRPFWTRLDGSQDNCNSCHGFPPPAPHPFVPDVPRPNGRCAPCHPDTATVDDGIVPGGQHVDGQVQINPVGFCDGCHGAPPNSGAHRVHFTGTPDQASYGGTDSAEDFDPGAPGYVFDCGSCHPTDHGRHGNGVLNPGGGRGEVDLSPAGARAGSLKAMNGANASYAPGDQVLVDDEGFEYTLGTCSEVYCHSRKVVTVPGPVPQPGRDFPFEGYPIVYPPYDVFVSRECSEPAWDGDLDCDGCHDFPPRTDPDNEGGAGDSHSWAGPDGGEGLHGRNHGWDPLACATCHNGTVTQLGQRDFSGPDGLSHYEPVPIAGFDRHVNGHPDIVFTADPVPYRDPMDLAPARYNPDTQTCTDVECHQAQVSVIWGTPYRWWVVNECDTCHQF